MSNSRHTSMKAKMNEYEEQYKLLRRKIQTVGNFKGQFVLGRNAMIEMEIQEKMSTRNF